jgi:hypothetical protein
MSAITQQKEIKQANKLALIVEDSIMAGQVILGKLKGLLESKGWTVLWVRSVDPAMKAIKGQAFEATDFDSEGEEVSVKCHAAASQSLSMMFLDNQLPLNPQSVDEPRSGLGFAFARRVHKSNPGIPLFAISSDPVSEKDLETKRCFQADLGKNPRNLQNWEKILRDLGIFK